MKVSQITEWYLKHEKIISIGALIAGFIFDSITLNRVDTLWDNLWIVSLLSIAGLSIIISNVYENHKQKVSVLTGEKIHFWLLMAMQFSFGGLMSTFLVFYFRSGTVSVNWPFFLLLILFMIGNEIFKYHYSRLTFQVSVLFVSLYSFSIFIVPVIIHRMGPWVFVLSGFLTIAVFSLFLWALSAISKERILSSKKMIIISVGGITLLINLLYFTNLIPPIPLALKDSGVYYSVVREDEDTYIVTEPKRRWWNFFWGSNTFDKTPEQSLYVYSAIFAPNYLNTTVVHDWQFFNEEIDEWQTMSEIKLSIVGGRDGGYRTYSHKENLLSGEWRVTVKTLQGQIIGRVPFTIDDLDRMPKLQTKTLES